MQFKLTLKTTGQRNVLPLSYQYEVSAWIYKVIANADAEFAEFLHRTGYTTERKNFKLFSFSHIDVPKHRIDGDRLYIECPEVYLRIGFYVSRAAEEFIRGLFQEQEVRLGDRQSQASFVVNTIEVVPLNLPSPDLSPVRIRAKSPMVVGRAREGAYDDYLHPRDPDFGPLLAQNLLDKYRAATGHDLPNWQPEQFRLRPVGNEPRSKLIKIKSGTKEETQIRGFLFDFELQAPRELLEIGLLGGFGKMGAQGFGFGEVVVAQR